MTETSTAIVGGRVVPVEGEPIEGGTVLLRDGKIAAVEGPDLSRAERAFLDGLEIYRYDYDLREGVFAGH